MEFVSSAHVRDRMLQRGINEATVKSIVLKPDYVKKSFDERKIATKKLDRPWHVIYKEEKGKIVLISVYFD